MVDACNFKSYWTNSCKNTRWINFKTQKMLSAQISNYRKDFKFNNFNSILCKRHIYYFIYNCQFLLWQIFVLIILVISLIKNTKIVCCLSIELYDKIFTIWGTTPCTSYKLCILLCFIAFYAAKSTYSTFILFLI